MTITEQLEQLKQVKQDIKQALIGKEVDMTGVAFSGYAGKIGEIRSKKVVTSTALACRNNNTYDPCYLFIGSTCPIVPSKIVLNVTQQNANASKSITWTFKLQGRRTGTATFDDLYTEDATITAGATKTFDNTVDLSSNTTEYDAFRVYVYDGVRTNPYSNYITVTGTITI